MRAGLLGEASQSVSWSPAWLGSFWVSLSGTGSSALWESSLAPSASLPSPSLGCTAREGSSVLMDPNQRSLVSPLSLFLILILSGGDGKCFMVEFSEETHAQMQGCWRASEPSVCGDGVAVDRDWWSVALSSPLCLCRFAIVKLCPTLCDPVDGGRPGFPVLYHLLEFAHTHVHWVSDAIQLSHSVSFLCHQSFPASEFFLVSWFFSSCGQSIGALSISPSNEYSGLISFGIDWFDLLPVQGTLQGLLQHHSSKVSVLWCSAFFMIQLSHPHMTTRKIIALTIRTFSAK